MRSVRLLPVVLLLVAAVLVRADGEGVPDGRTVYLEEACWQCHVQAHDRGFPALEGTERTGPVLGATRVPRSRAWHLANLYDPRAVLAGSRMPSYRRRFAADPREAGVRALLARHDRRFPDGILTQREYEETGGDDWAGVLEAFDSGNGVISLADAAPRPDAGVVALVDYLLALGPAVPPAAAPPPERKPADPAASIARGRTLFLRLCAGCHGEDGDGNGPAAPFFGDHPPRNFLRGEYKFRSTLAPDPPLDTDLFRTIRRGAGGSMPGWPQLADRQVWDLVEYLKALHPGYLPRELFIESTGGEVEFAFVQGTEDEPPDVPDATGVALEHGRVAKRHGRWFWNDRPITDGMQVQGYRFRLGRPVYGWMEGYAPRPLEIPDPPFPYSEASAEQGAAIYEQLSCGKCHGPEGRGDGVAADQTRGPLGQVMVPSDYTDGFKGGGDPRSLVRTFLTGLHGTPMPAYGDNFTDPAAPWHLAHFVIRQAMKAR